MSLNKTNATRSNCSGSNFTTRNGGCLNCIDSATVLKSYTNASTLLRDLNIRYPSCNTFNNNLTNIWTNYYYVRYNSIIKIRSRVTNGANNITYLIRNITGPLTTIINNFKTNLSGTTSDSIYGMVTGLNCTVVG